MGKAEFGYLKKLLVLLELSQARRGGLDNTDAP